MRIFKVKEENVVSARGGTTTSRKSFRVGPVAQISGTGRLHDFAPERHGQPPDPPTATNKHRLTPATKRQRNAAFAIIAEPRSNAGSRSPSPTGRVSPFRGRGFNPAGSRHASPHPSPPPPEDRRFPSSKNHPTNAPEKPSKIPTLSRRGSTAELYVEAATTDALRPGRTKTTNIALAKQLSQSLTNVSSRQIVHKPPPSPQRTNRYTRIPAFQKLSPIIGSSPEPTPDSKYLKSKSSPSKIPRSRSQPPNNRISPNVSAIGSRVNSRNPSRNASRTTSRESSPNKINPKPNYKNVKAKVNSYHATKPKVPPKPQVPKQTERPKLDRKDSVIRSTRTNDNNNFDSSSDTANNRNSSKAYRSSRTDDSDSSASIPRYKGGGSKKGNLRTIHSKTETETELEDEENETRSEGETSAVETTDGYESKIEDNTPKLIVLLGPSTTAVVSSTTTTVTKPLKIEARFDIQSKEEDVTVYLPDARALSATSVSTAINKMNDTVLDTKTLMKETNLSSRIPSGVPSAVSSTVYTVPSQTKPKETVAEIKPKTTTIQTETVNSTNTTTTPTTTTTTTSTNNNNNNPIATEITNNNVSSINNNDQNAKVGAKTNETNGKTNAVQPKGNSVGLDVLPKSAGEKTKEKRTMVATDVQPIRITVKEKPSDPEVQSGNVRLPVSATNGVGGDRPGLPPSQPPQDEPPSTTAPEPPNGRCGRLLGCCRKSPDIAAAAEKSKRLSCFAKKKDEPKSDDKIEGDASSATEEADPKRKWWQKLRFFRRKKVGDAVPVPSSHRKDSWAERASSHVSDATRKSPKDKCKNFLRTIFCINFCQRKRRKEQEEVIERRSSIMSKKKSLTPPAPTEEPSSKLDAVLVEHTSVMKAAIPVLPVPLAWFCLILNVFLPGIGTIVSGFLCLCMGKPRFSTKDGMKQRVGACIIDFFIGCGQLFTVLFCLVGWGWSIWWGFIMLKLAKKYRKIRRAERAMEEDSRPAVAMDENHMTRDPERGS